MLVWCHNMYVPITPKHAQPGMRLILWYLKITDIFRFNILTKIEGTTLSDSDVHVLNYAANRSLPVFKEWVWFWGNGKAVWNSRSRWERRGAIAPPYLQVCKNSEKIWKKSAKYFFEEFCKFFYKCDRLIHLSHFWKKCKKYKFPLLLIVF